VGGERLVLSANVGPATPEVALAELDAIVESIELQ